MHEVSNKSPFDLDFIWIKSIVCGVFWLPTQEFYGLQKNDIKRIFWKYCTLLETTWIQNEQHNLGMLLCNHLTWILPFIFFECYSFFSWRLNGQPTLEIRNHSICPFFNLIPCDCLSILSSDFLICQNHEEDFFKFCVLLKKSKL